MNRAYEWKLRGVSGPGVCRFFLLLALLAMAFPPIALAQAPDLDRLDRFMARAQEDWPVPGFAVAIVKDGKTVLAKGYGVREVGGRRTGR